MSSKALLAVLLPAAAVLLACAIVFFVAIAPPMSQEQPEGMGEISSGRGVLGVPPQVSTGDGVAVSESSNASTERGDEMPAEAITKTGDFVLTISAEKTSVSRGERFWVYIGLKNNSGEDREIKYSRLFMPQIEGWCPFGDAQIGMM